MDTDDLTIRKILGHRHQWIVPVYQRHYEWESKKEAQIPKLWETMEEKTQEHLGEGASNRKEIPYYFGAIICESAKKENSGARFGEDKIEYDYLVDGQQRITSFQIALIAIREVAKLYRASDTVDEANNYIFNSKISNGHPSSEDDFKLRPSKMDRSLFEEIARKGFESFITDHSDRFHPNTHKPIDKAENLIKAYWTLYQEIKKMVEQQGKDEERNPKEVLAALLKGFLDGFKVVVIRLDEEDDAQEIFASLNGLGKKLSLFDLVRNDVFLRARKKDGNDWESLLEQEWDYLEKDYWYQSARRGRKTSSRAEDLIAHVVVAETARQIPVSKIATEYRRYAESRGYASVSEEVKVLKKHAGNYRNLEEYKDDYMEANPVTRLAKVFDSWDITTFHPLVLWVCYNIESEEMQKEIFDLIEAFIIRREICGLTERNYNKLVPSMIGKMSEGGVSVGDPVYALREYITNIKSNTSKMPEDNEVLDAFHRNPTSDSTSNRRVRHILVKLEYAKRDDYSETQKLDESNLTLEHIMPRAWANEWPLPNRKHAIVEDIYDIRNEGLDTETRDMIRKRSEVIYTYGNLTLLTDRLNPSVSNKEWKEKRKIIKEKSLLTMNLELAEEEVWNEETIKKRAEELAKIAIGRWKFTPTS